MTALSTIVAHILAGGRALCGLYGTPDNWPPQHRWVGVTEVDAVAHSIVAPIEWCAKCKAAYDRRTG